MAEAKEKTVKEKTVKEKTVKKKAVKKKAVKKRTRKKTPTPEEVWTSLKSEVDLGSIKSYSMAETFAVNTAIEHPKFGLGVVTASHPSKINVVFQDGERSLVQSR